MHKFLSFIKEFHIPKKQDLTDALASFSKKEFYIFTSIVVIAFISMLLILNSLNNKFLVDVPVSGGTITEGIIGMPTLVNPVTSLSNADKDLVSIVYSGLLRRSPDGALIPDLAESYTVSSDGTTYTFVIKKNATFQDGTKLTADDIVFTINKIKDPVIKSPISSLWDGIDVEKVDDQTVNFKLKKPYISFLDNMTVGILPSHIWQEVKDTEFNISPFNIKAIGSGPYKINSISKNSEGIPTSYSLKKFSNFVLGDPKIKYVNIVSFANEKDLTKAIISHSVDLAGGLNPKNTKELMNSNLTINVADTSRIFGIFLNKSNSKILSDPSVVDAINKTLDKQEFINAVLNGYGKVVNSPIPETIVKSDNAISNTDIDEANKILDKDGWTMGADGIRVKGGTSIITKIKKVGKKTVTKKVKVNNGAITRLEFSLTTGDTTELIQSATIIKEQLAKVGISVDTKKVYETGQLNQVIKNRDYEALFFGQIINHESSLYSFWHSSQRKDPGLNISMYDNPKVDKILEDAQKTISETIRISKYKDFVLEFNKDIPALLIYSPRYLYVSTDRINNMNINTLITPSDRFSSIYTWYANKDHVWKIFTK